MLMLGEFKYSKALHHRSEIEHVHAHGGDLRQLTRCFSDAYGGAFPTVSCDSLHGKSAAQGRAQLED